MSKKTNKIVALVLGQDNEKVKDVALLLFRLTVGVFMLTHGLQKLAGFDMLKTAFPDPIGMGAELSLVLIILAEAGCSLLLIFGAFTRLAVLPLIFGMLVAAFGAHGADPFAVKELALLYLSMYVVLMLLGGGRYSVDYLLQGLWSKRKAS